MLHVPKHGHMRERKQGQMHVHMHAGPKVEDPPERVDVRTMDGVSP
ncbi:hypothetical protein [Actinoplanes nipponensis]|nr:hypothetical protein [Actinoplanes nipponensis]